MEGEVLEILPKQCEVLNPFVSRKDIIKPADAGYYILFLNTFLKLSLSYLFYLIFVKSFLNPLADKLCVRGLGQ